MRFGYPTSFTWQACGQRGADVRPNFNSVEDVRRKTTGVLNA
jgi:hypothetical protein